MTPRQGSPQLCGRNTQYGRAPENQAIPTRGPDEIRYRSLCWVGVGLYLLLTWAAIAWLLVQAGA